MTAPPVIAQPDLEAWVWANISAVPGVTSFCFSAIRDWPFWLVAYAIQVDARASTKAGARDRAEQVRLIIDGLPYVDWADGVVAYAQPTDGPFWLPDSDGEPRYCARYDIRAHPLQVVP